jgi:hypothetical protein
MKTKSIISLVVTILLIVVSAFLFQESKVIASGNEDAVISGMVYSYGNCNTVGQLSAIVEFYDRTTSTVLGWTYSDLGGYYQGTAPVGHHIRVTAISHNKIGCIYFVQPEGGNKNADICINMPGTVCQNEE